MAGIRYNDILSRMRIYQGIPCEIDETIDGWEADYNDRGAVERFRFNPECWEQFREHLKREFPRACYF